jgi:GTP-binding protein
VDIVIEPDFQVEQTNDGWRVTGKKAARLAAITHFDQDEAVSRFQNILVKWGVEDALVKAGARAGDAVTVGDHRLTFRPALKHRSKR